MIPQEKIRELIMQGEVRHTNIEFKRCRNEIGNAVYETICSFLNRNGGDILIGVEENGDIIGVNETAIDNHIKNIVNSLNNIEIFNPVIFLTPEVVEIDGKKIIYIRVPESSQVHRFKNKVFDRVGDADTNITNSYHLIENMYLRKNKSSSESHVCPHLSLNELDDSSFKRMRTHIALYNPTHPWIEMSNEEMLHSAGFWRRDPLTNQEGYILAVVLLFGREQTILNYCPWHRTDAIYRNMSYTRFLKPLPTDPDVRYNDRDMVCVNLIESYIRLMNFIERNMPDVFALDERGINRLDLRNMLFREIVSNLLLHREFASTFSSKLLIFSDRVITENWTKPMQIGSVTLETLETHTKNPLITKVFREMKWAEELGSGKKNIRKYAPLYYDKYKIEIQNNEKFIFSITYNASIDEDKGQTCQINSLVTDHVTDQVSDQVTDHVTDHVTDQVTDYETDHVTDQGESKQDSSTQELKDSGTQVKSPKKKTSRKKPQEKSPKKKAPRKRPQEKNLKKKQILEFCYIPRNMIEIMTHFGYRHKHTFRQNHIQPLLEEGLLSMTIPENPKHRKQKYITTEKGKATIHE